MKDFAITATRDLDRAAQRLQDLERYADRRGQLLETLDLDLLGPDQLSRIFAEDEQINEDLAWGHLYINHLAEMEALGSSIERDLRLAA
ncbi:hypothetical protein [Novosphingobium sp. AP12]|uniref:hypothetical protein n=1 Tax=Novosphingobium sp. AP12 TaxID=1144305 RepID=UPI000271DE1C|nr:hypothetical protein [Novosphingobium sp. AP12]EJL20428.1 hypothetical protein PMI02_05547 [Novosphingobium sp. AP12]